MAMNFNYTISQLQKMLTSKQNLLHVYENEPQSLSAIGEDISNSDSMITHLQFEIKELAAAIKVLKEQQNDTI